MAGALTWAWPPPRMPAAWRIIPGFGYVVHNHGDRKPPKDRVGLVINWFFMAYTWGLIT